MDTIKNFKRTNMCGEVLENCLGKEVIVMGWVAKERNLGSIIFMDIRDTTGIVQVVVNETDNKELLKRQKE